MKKVFVLSNSLFSGGAEKQSIYLTSVLSRNHDASLIVFNRKDSNDPKLLKLADNLKINTIYLEGAKPKQFFNFYNLLKKHKPEFIFSFLMYTNILNGIAGTLAGVKNRIGGIRNCYIPPLKMRVQKFIHNYLLSCTVTNNYSSLKELGKARFRNDKIKVIPNCIKAEEQVIKRSNNETINLLTTGRFVSQKNFPGLIRIFKKVIEKNSSKRVKLYIIGFGELENEIRDMLKNNNVTDAEIVINPVDLPSYYRQADIYLSTSFFEGMSNSIMEAMAYSLPVVATKVGDNDKLVLNNETGYLIDLKNEDEFADKLLYLINNYEVRIKLGSCGNEYIRENYSERKYEENIRSLVEY